MPKRGTYSKIDLSPVFRSPKIWVVISGLFAAVLGGFYFFFQRYLW